MAKKIFSDTLYFSDEEIGTLAGFYLGRSKDLQKQKPEDGINIMRCESMASMFISYMPLEFQNEFRESMEMLFNDPKVNKLSHRFIKGTIKSLIKKTKE